MHPDALVVDVATPLGFRVICTADRRSLMENPQLGSDPLGRSDSERWFLA